MLVLMRKPGEMIRIGEDIVVTVIGVTERKIELGIAAPREVAVDREEVALRKQAERKQRAQPR